MERADLLELLDNYMDPSGLDYQEWLQIGMALKEEGCSVSDWEAWSRRDAARYRQGECARKWAGFNGAGTPVTGGTIVQMAMDRGWRPKGGGHELEWDGTISKDDGVIVDKDWIEGKEIREPEDWHPEKELIAYIDTLFGTDDIVGYVTRSWSRPDDDRKYPDKGCWDRTARQLIQKLGKCNGDIGSVLGDYDQEVGAWIRFNPLDGNGCKDANVTEYRYALVESDAVDLERQNAIIRELELPVACLVHSGRKSLHAIVKVDAASLEEYKKRVNYLYEVCERNGLKIDRQNRNPSRLSRMPGVVRGGRKQFLIDTNIGKATWGEWQEWIESVSDDLPEPESLESVWDDLPELSPCLIEGVLRKGHKMLLAGPSKAGKSFLQIELCIAIAEGRRWLGWQCAKGKVMYVNLELDRASCLHRFRDVYGALGWLPAGLRNIDVWNLRGKSCPMDKLAPKLIRRALKKGYVAIIIDPIYKVITGDENSADQMAAFCNQFDKVCTELGCAVIYCHHHSKGSQGAKRSMDRASGSGVFARDPDALLDLIELETTEALLKQEENKAVCRACQEYLEGHLPGWEEDVSQDDMLSHVQMLAFCKKKLTEAQNAEVNARCIAAAEKARTMTAWRIEGTLREFPKFEPVDIWFDYPVHRPDAVGSLKDIQPEAEKPVWQKAAENRKRQAEDKQLKKRNEFEIEFSNIELDGREVPAQELAEKLGTNSKELLSWLGDTKRQKRDLKKDFEKYIGGDGKAYIRRNGSAQD